VWPFVLMKEDWDRARCWAVRCLAVPDLVKAVQAGKALFGREASGAFIVNEFGQVIVPASDGDGRRAIVGEIQGELTFEDPFENGAVFNLSDCKDLRGGEKWCKPYVGVKYNWSIQDGIHFRGEHEEGTNREVCPHQDSALIRALRAVRNETYCRFIVNPHGLVLTKKQLHSAWCAVYVGRINYKLWFPKEEG
jgi:hypothetical protein